MANNISTKALGNSVRNYFTAAKNAILPQRETAEECLERIRTRSQEISTFVDTRVIPRARRFVRRIGRTLLIWCIIGVGAMLAAQQLPSFVEEYPAVYNVATFGLKFCETLFNYFSLCAADIVESFKDFSITSSINCLTSFFKNRSICSLSL